MSVTILEDLVLSHSAEVVEVQAPFDKVNIEAWLKALPDKEYQRCAPGDHKAAGYTVDDDGTPMSINVEMIGTGLVIQHYRYEQAGPHYCRMVSTSDVLTPNGWTNVQVIWELKMEQIDGDNLRYTNTVTSHPTEEMLKMVAEHGGTFEQAAAARQEASGAHNKRETPLFAASIVRAATA
ncbi:hypothetical protein FB565_008917 [Actinoplanes lutulentus]|uniref:Polyketide cyclase/dehydrase/lipid transport protein n=1 Tax=Actinoplanes lutulentus TaxID=1287878 RepID=A0A327Z522_9ACTN|nr:hypothetical protein [Actinoplanes lutulentus]MBB2949112.1 hypothetical protein [Actinoplanes lutulentus]RAK31433.1 hypothetical protein B0I29_115240 [Actinoplanes lutulentus]